MVHHSSRRQILSVAAVMRKPLGTKTGFHYKT